MWTVGSGITVIASDDSDSTCQETNQSLLIFSWVTSETAGITLQEELI